MEQQLKRVVGGALVVALLAGSYAVLLLAQSYATSQQQAHAGRFSSQGEGKVVITPDIATFSFSVITQGGANLKEIQDRNAKLSNDAISYVKQQGVQSEDITTQAYRVDPRYQYYNCSQSNVCPPADIVGYTVTQSTSVKVRDFSKVGDILAGVVENGANSVSQLTFTADKIEDVQKQARTLAIAAAQEKAKAVAEETGFKLGRLVSVSDGGVTPLYSPQAMDAAYASKAPAIEPGSQQVVVDVVLEYEMR